jgi:hypothetical protein
MDEIVANTCSRIVWFASMSAVLPYSRRKKPFLGKGYCAFSCENIK